MTSALVSGLFYLAPGAGFLVGSVLGGRLSDKTVRKFIARRGFRLPQDRLNSGLFMLFLILPGATLVYAWTLQQEKGGMPVPIIAGFVGGVGLMGSFNGLNTYAAGISLSLLPFLPFILLEAQILMCVCRSSPLPPRRGHKWEVYHPVYIFRRRQCAGCPTD